MRIVRSPSYNLVTTAESVKYISAEFALDQLKIFKNSVNFPCWSPRRVMVERFCTEGSHGDFYQKNQINRRYVSGFRKYGSRDGHESCAVAAPDFGGCRWMSRFPR